MRPTLAALACMLLIAGVAGLPLHGQAPGARPPAVKFDGNVASLDWGAKVERVTGIDLQATDANEAAQAEAAASVLIDGPETLWGSAWDGPPKEIVLSFFKREPALVNAVSLTSLDDPTPVNVVKDVEISVSMTSPTDGFTKVATAALSAAAEGRIAFDPVEARFVKIRLITNQSGGTRFELFEIKVMEAQRAGYVPLLTRRPEILGPLAPGASGPPVTVTAAGPSCQPAPDVLPKPGRDKSRKVLVISPSTTGIKKEAYRGIGIRVDREDGVPTPADLAVVDDIDMRLVRADLARPWHLNDEQGYDTVVLEQVCSDHQALTSPFKRALVAWVAAGHKLIIHDADKCSPGPDYGWLPFRIKTDNPGALGAEAQALRIVEDSWMIHGRPGRPGFVDTSAWIAGSDNHRNELGDTNVITAWDGNWCGQMVVRNANDVTGFGQAYAHYGRGLIMYGGYDIDMHGTTGYDEMIARELAQGFNPDNLPCSVRVGSFIITTEPRYRARAITPGQSAVYPLSVLSALKYKGTVTLSASPSPPIAGFQARFEPATIAVSNAHDVRLTVALPAGVKPESFAVEVKGTASDGKTSSLCLQLGPPKAGELSVVSALSPPSKTRKNLEIILDVSGSMKTLMGKKSRWDTALATLQEVLARLPEDFNVGLRLYGHREASTSPKTCTDSELAVPIEKLDRQAIMNAAKAVKPRGETPLVYSALQAPADLKDLGGGTVILITDGGESCKGDPMKAATELKASGLDIRLNIVGFAVTDPAVQKVLAGFAQAGGGRFYAAQSGPALADALLIAAIEKFPYEVFDVAGKKVAEGDAGGPTDELPPGDYKVVVKAGAKEIVAPRVRVTLGQQTTLKIVLKGDQLALE